MSSQTLKKCHFQQKKTSSLRALKSRHYRERMKVEHVKSLKR